jgi:hypothetical protein
MTLSVNGEMRRQLALNLVDPAYQVFLGRPARRHISRPVGRAVAAAKQYYDDVNGCYYCANECHTT